MDISPADLAAQATKALIQWPFILTVEIQNGLPKYTLLAVGSRETNLVNERSGMQPGGHQGFGVWQEDNQHAVVVANPDFMTNVQLQAETAAQMLAPNIRAYGLDGAFDAYNSGRPVDADTTGGDYGPDVCGRLAWLTDNASSWLPANLQEDEMPTFVDVPGMIVTTYEAVLGRGPTNPELDASIADAAAGKNLTDLTVKLRIFKNNGGR